MRFRTWGTEWLDSPDVAEADLRASYAEVWGVNRYFGGMPVLMRHLAPFLQPGIATVLDVAGGTGDVALALSSWAARRGVDLRIALLDQNPAALTVARERLGPLPGAVVVQGDACRMPFREGQFDVAFCNLALHHFTDRQAAQVMREMARVCRRGWVIADLERHMLAYASARVMARALWRHPITRHDGPLSVKRSFTCAEAHELVAEAGVPARVYKHFPFRLAWVGDPV